MAGKSAHQQVFRPAVMPQVKVAPQRGQRESALTGSGTAFSIFRLFAMAIRTD